MTKLNYAEYAGWKNCVHAHHNGLKLIITLDVGPRIISCSVDDGPNLFKEFDDQLGKTSGDEYMLFGGHRLWHAPEEFPRSYCPDFDPVDSRWEKPVLYLNPPTEVSTGIRKCMELHFESGNRVRVRHKLTNMNAWAIELAPWSATLLAPGSRGIIPQEDYRPHPEHLYPARTVTLWHFTRMNDPRVRWGDRFIQLREDGTIDQKIKFGLSNKQGWAACWNSGYLFIKTFSYDENATYADLGCNFEAFTMPGFLELESLGPLDSLEPKCTFSHDEIWHVWPCDELPQDESALQEKLNPFIDQLLFPEQ